MKIEYLYTLWIHIVSYEALNLSVNNDNLNLYLTGFFAGLGYINPYRLRVLEHV